MEDIGKKAHDDELNKSKPEIGQSPRKFIPVPKVNGNEFVRCSECERCSLKKLKKVEAKEYLLCAAIRRIEPRDCPKVYWEQFHDIYKIELGWRHSDIMHRFGKEVSRHPNDQGFYTSKGRFVTREEGLEIAKAAGQVDKIIGGVLTSEDLY